MYALHLLPMLKPNLLDWMSAKPLSLIFARDSVKHNSDSIGLLLRPTLMGTTNLYENGPNPFLLFGTNNMVRVKLMATVLFRHGFNNYSKLVYAGEIQQ